MVWHNKELNPQQHNFFFQKIKGKVTVKVFEQLVIYNNKNH